MQRGKATSKREKPSLLEMTKMYQERNAEIFGRKESNSVCYDATRSPQIHPPRRLPPLDERVRERAWQHLLDAIEKDEAKNGAGAGPRQAATGSKNGSSSSGHSKSMRAPQRDYFSSNEEGQSMQFPFWQKFHTVNGKEGGFKTHPDGNEKRGKETQGGSKGMDRWMSDGTRRMAVCDITDGAAEQRRFARIVRKRL